MMKQSNMYILHIETSTTVCSVALSDGPHLMEVIDLVEGMNHTALLAPAIDQLLKVNQLTPKHLRAISVSSGPGSYTGLRVGSSTAKAMAYSLQIPLLPVHTLLALAYGAFAAHPQLDFAVPMLDARRKEVYVAVYDRDMGEISPTCSLILEQEALEAILPADKGVICGDGAHKIEHIPKGHIVDTSIKSSASHLVKPAFHMLENGMESSPMHFVPFYLKPPNITQTKKIF